MTESTRARLPQHLRKYVVEQNYARYSPEDQAVWRYIMRQLTGFLSTHAHPSYLDGFKKSGLEVERIPRIEVVDLHLEKFGWGAVAVSGFIPPAAFMEFQAIGILPIASDMRTLEHLQYTPAPDIVHEAAGHAPILVQPDYAAYLRMYGEVARHAIISREDLAQYEAIRILSDLKENPESSSTEIQSAEMALLRINQNLQFTSEATLLSRMNWWTAEYGLIGDLKTPKIFGAGLLSSIGEARACFAPTVRKIPLTVDCVDFSYDITEPQPHLFVTEDFAQLGDVLQQLSQRLAYKRGGAFGLDRAIEAETVNTVVLDSGLQISGVLKSYLTDAMKKPCYLQFEGPTQLAVEGQELDGQGCAQHSSGFSSPLGNIKKINRPPHLLASSEREALGLVAGRRAQLEFDSGLVVSGQIKNWTQFDGTPILLTWTDCTVRRGDTVLFQPAWGTYDMALGLEVVSVFGGPADRSCYINTDDFIAAAIPLRQYSTTERKRHQLFQRLHALRQLAPASEAATTEFQDLMKTILTTGNTDWLLSLELLELSVQFKVIGATENLRRHLESFSDARESIDLGLKLVESSLKDS